MAIKKVICTIIKNEHKYLAEWIEHNLSLGFDTIYLYEDYNTDSHKDITDKYDNVILDSIENTYDPHIITNQIQVTLFNWFINNYKNTCDYIAFIDVDEYIMLDGSITLDDIIKECGNGSNIWLSWKTIGASGIINNEKNTRIDTFFNVCDDKWKDYKCFSGKSIFNCATSSKMINPHAADGVTVDVNNSTIDNTRNAELVWSKCWINHYFTSSWCDYMERLHKQSIIRGHRSTADFFVVNPDMAYKRDELMSMYKEKYPEDFVTKVTMNLGTSLKVKSNTLFTNKMTKTIGKSFYLDIIDNENTHIIGTIVEKCCTSTLIKAYFNSHNIKSKATDYTVHSEFFNMGKRMLTDVSSIENKLVFKVIRNPVDRWLSAWKSIAADFDYNEYVYSFKKSIKYVPIEGLDRHLLPQFYYKEQDDNVDIYVWHEDLDDFLAQYGIIAEHINANPRENTEYEIPQEVYDFYKIDTDKLASGINIWQNPKKLEVE